MGVKRKWLGPGSRTSYKLPIISGEEGKLFYDWLNRCDSINGTITEALKIKFMIDTMSIHNSLNKNSKEDVIDIEEIGMIDEEIKINKNHCKNTSQEIDLEMIKKTFMSVKR